MYLLLHVHIHVHIYMYTYVCAQSGARMPKTRAHTAVQTDGIARPTSRRSVSNVANTFPGKRAREVRADAVRTQFRRNDHAQSIRPAGANELGMQCRSQVRQAPRSPSGELAKRTQCVTPVGANPIAGGETRTVCTARGAGCTFSARRARPARGAFWAIWA